MNKIQTRLKWLPDYPRRRRPVLSFRLLPVPGLTTLPTFRQPLRRRLLALRADSERVSFHVGSTFAGHRNVGGFHPLGQSRADLHVLLPRLGAAPRETKPHSSVVNSKSKTLPGRATPGLAGYAPAVLTRSPLHYPGHKRASQPRGRFLTPVVSGCRKRSGRKAEEENIENSLAIHSLLSNFWGPFTPPGRRVTHTRLYVLRYKEPWSLNLWRPRTASVVTLNDRPYRLSGVGTRHPAFATDRTQPASLPADPSPACGTSPAPSRSGRRTRRTRSCSSGRGSSSQPRRPLRSARASGS